jgi:hypothetical protein
MLATSFRLMMPKYCWFLMDCPIKCWCIIRALDDSLTLGKSKLEIRDRITHHPWPLSNASAKPKGVRAKKTSMISQKDDWLSTSAKRAEALSCSEVTSGNFDWWNPTLIFFFRNRTSERQLLTFWSFGRDDILHLQVI